MPAEPPLAAITPMTAVDYCVLFGYLLGVVLVGLVFARQNRDASQMFAAGGASPWWAAGLSGFMTMFSAATFVVWGGIAYEHGVVAVAINMCYGVAALLAGYFVAGRWRALGIRTPAEFIRLRYGVAALTFCTWSMMLFRMIGTGVALYSLAVQLVALMPLEPGNVFRDPATGAFSLTWAILIFGGVVIAYTMLGGLWAVLMTDVLQFIVLNLAVMLVVPLLLLRVGGLGQVVEQAPPRFFSPVAADYTWFFLAGWCAIHFFMIGAEWAFVQRFICVSSPKEARKGAYLFGVLYLFSPLLWLAPPLIWRVESPIPPDASREEIGLLANQAYIQACRSVLPAGMIGMMLAAMFSATASMVSSQLNVFAGVLTSDFYQPLFARRASDRHLVWAGRAFTLAIGAVIVAIALAVDRFGGPRAIVISITSLLVAPLLAPTIWGLFSRYVNAAAVWTTVAICVPIGLVVKVGFAADGALASVDSLSWWTNLIQTNHRTIDIVLGVILPVSILMVVQLGSRKVATGWKNIEALAATSAAAPRAPVVANRLPARVVGVSLAICSAVMVALALQTKLSADDRNVLFLFALALGLISAAVWYWSQRAKPALNVGMEPKHVEI